MQQPTLEPLALSSSEALLLQALVAKTCPRARVVAVSRIVSSRLSAVYALHSKELGDSSPVGLNEHLLFHGTGATPTDQVLQHRDGLDPRFSSGTPSGIEPETARCSILLLRSTRLSL
jgi:hypothetical protein